MGEEIDEEVRETLKVIRALKKQTMPSSCIFDSIIHIVKDRDMQTDVEFCIRQTASKHIAYKMSQLTAVCID